MDHKIVKFPVVFSFEGLKNFSYFSDNLAIVRFCFNDKRDQDILQTAGS